MPGHNSVYYMTGVLLLWFGFYGFNPGTMGQIIAADGTDYSIVRTWGSESSRLCCTRCGTRISCRVWCCTKACASWQGPPGRQQPQHNMRS